MISFTSRAPKSAWPLATFCAAPAPSVARSALRCASSAMPSLRSAARKAVPLAPSFAQVSVFAASTAFISPTGEVKSGFWAPLRTMMPTAERAIGVSDPAAILPCFASSAMSGLVRMARSNAAPPSISRCISAATPHLIATLLPVAFSNCGASSSSAALTPLEAMTARSAACATDVSARADTAASARIGRFMRASRGSGGTVYRCGTRAQNHRKARGECKTCHGRLPRNIGTMPPPQLTRRKTWQRPMG